jgi:hypothetical protein
VAATGGRSRNPNRQRERSTPTSVVSLPNLPLLADKQDARRPPKVGIGGSSILARPPSAFNAPSGGCVAPGLAIRGSWSTATAGSGGTRVSEPSGPSRRAVDSAGASEGDIQGERFEIVLRCRFAELACG